MISLYARRRPPGTSMARARREGRLCDDPHGKGRTRPDLVSGRSIRVSSPRDLRRVRRRRDHRCWDHLIVAPLWPLHGAN
ncbi:MAG: hypothetical protein ACRDP6_25015, partial [Actinoallomurus sp.]